MRERDAYEARATNTFSVSASGVHCAHLSRGDQRAAGWQPSACLTTAVRPAKTALDPATTRPGPGSQDEALEAVREHRVSAYGELPCACAARRSRRPGHPGLARENRSWKRR